MKITLHNAVLPVVLFLASLPAFSWEHHQLITEPVLAAIEEEATLTPAVVVELETFLSAVEGPLALFLAEEEDWARNHLPFYSPRPDSLAFVATNDPTDIRNRFFRAIRINPNIKTPLYFCVLSGNAAPGAALLAPDAVTLFPHQSTLASFNYIAVQPGGVLNALDIIAAASNEPDLGMDTGLYEDNDTSFGQEYGFGRQPFGNPALEYGTQAPFHIGFYHESTLVFLFAGFLKESHLEYRIRLFKRLSEFAFEHGQDYWGWRFMGWGLHYVADLSMPYHTTVLPGYSALRMLWINFLDILGYSKPVDHALQLVSNRHIAIELYQRIVAEEALRADETPPFLAVLADEYALPPYTDTLPREQMARDSNRLARKLDWAIARYMPHDFVSNPGVELADVDERVEIVTMIRETHGEDALAQLNELLAEALQLFAIYGRSYALDILASRESMTLGE